MQGRKCRVFKINCRTDILITGMSTCLRYPVTISNDGRCYTSWYNQTHCSSKFHKTPIEFNPSMQKKYMAEFYSNSCDDELNIESVGNDYDAHY